MKTLKIRTDERYIEILKEVLQSKKVWERNELITELRKKLKEDNK